ncbi:hypothetical protein ACEPAI_2714 [Sanghuangporus weigelae]
MKLLFSLAFLFIALSFESAFAAARPGGSKRFLSARSSARGHVTKDKYHSSSSHGSGSKNWTSNAFPERYKGVYSNYTSSTASSVAPHRLESAPAKTHHQSRRNSFNSLGYNPSGIKIAHGMHPTSPSPTRTTSVSSSSRAIKSTNPKAVRRSPMNIAPTPAPTVDGSSDTTVYINDEGDFALLLPNISEELISDAESDGVSFCMSGGCTRAMPDGFITAAAVERAPDGVSWIQVTGCIDPSKSTLSTSDDGGQFDVRFPNGAQCTFGGYGASFIEQVEPSANRFCLRCCANENDQTNCNSHQDRAGCPIAIPGTYDFPDKGVYCA